MDRTGSSLLRGLRGVFASARHQVIPLLSFPSPDRSQLLRRIMIMERDVILPLKVAGIAMLYYSFHFRPWIGKVLGSLEIAVEWTQYFLLFYVAANVIVTIGLFSLRRMSLGLVQWMVFANCLLDGLFVSTLTLVTGGYDSFLYWFFPALIVRSAVSVPRATSQIMLNLTLCICYVVAGFIDIGIARNLDEELRATPPTRQAAARTNETTPRLIQAEKQMVVNERGVGSSLPARTNETTPRRIRAEKQTVVSERGVGSSYSADSLFSDTGNVGETLLLRLVVLLLMVVCSYGVQLLLERQRRAMEEAREFAVREGQLRSAGRIAAEFVHQFKNPLGIINNAAFSLSRALRDGRAPPAEQVQIIQEEVERSDRIITQVMGYAQLSEGRVEKLDVLEELELAIERVFPPAAGYPVAIHRDYGRQFPPLLMQRRHLSETFINILQNAREAFSGSAGNIWVSAHSPEENSIEVRIADDGPGIPADKHERIFEAYYTTREKGTGLGLASVKHNVELYGGRVHVESELGKGASFILVFPARALLDVPVRRLPA